MIVNSECEENENIMSGTYSQTQTVEAKVKNKEHELREAVKSKNVDEVIEKVKAVDYVCSFAKCKTKTRDFAIDCKFCKGRFCTSHGLPEIHGCGEAIKREERRKMLHPENKLSQEKHSQTQTKLAMKLKQMELERKPKANVSKTKKK